MLSDGVDHSSQPVVQDATFQNANHFHALWEEVHMRIDPSPEWFAAWSLKVSSVTCGCDEWLRIYVIANPPRFDDWPRWTWELHNAVNAKLSKQHFSWSDYQNKYPKWKSGQASLEGAYPV